MARMEITGLNLGGEGIIEGLPDPRAFALPGDIYVSDNDELLEQSPDRQTPPCAHFGACGGCVLQHARDDFVANWKTEITRKALSAHGLTPDFREIITSPPASRRRAVFAARRTKKTVQIGFHERRSDTLIPITECAVVMPELLSEMELYQALTRLGASRASMIRIHVTHSENGLDIGVADAKELSRDQLSELSQLVQGTSVTRLSWNDEVLLREQPAYQRFGAALVEPPPGAFLQATAHGEAALVTGIKEALSGAVQVIDLFAGCGTFTLPIAENAEVLAVESEAEMLAALDAGWRQATGLRSVSTETRDLFRRPFLASEFKGFDAAIIDPPRAGAAAQVAELAGSKLERIAFAACNPVTFARDAKVLCAAGFTLDWVQVVDQFRWSPHVELVAQFTR